MSTFTEHKHLGDWLKGEEQDVTDYCRETVTILAGESIGTGTVLGIITATGKYVQMDPAATDGSQTAAGILITDSLEGDTIGDSLAAALVRGPATVSKNGLTWIAGITDNQILTALASLKTLGIVARDGA